MGLGIVGTRPQPTHPRAVDHPPRSRFHATAQDAPSRDAPRLDVPTSRVDASDGRRPDFDAIVAFARAP